MEKEDEERAKTKGERARERGREKEKESELMGRKEPTAKRRENGSREAQRNEPEPSGDVPT